MPIIKSAKKRVRTAEKAAARNSKVRKSIRSSIKALQDALEKSDKKQLTKLYTEAQSALDQGVKKHIIHKNKAARKKSQLSSQIKNAGAKVTTPPKTKSTSNSKPTTKAKTTPKKAVKKS